MSGYVFLKNVQILMKKLKWHFFYVLFELEMIDKAKERHRSHSKGEYKFIDAYLDLRSLNKNYPFDIFILQPQNA